MGFFGTFGTFGMLYMLYMLYIIGLKGPQSVLSNDENVTGPSMKVAPSFFFNVLTKTAKTTIFFH